MYYLDKNITLIKGLKQEEYNIHIITYLGIDYLNREMMAYIMSFKSIAELAKSFINKDSTVNCVSSSFSLNYEMQTFNIDPVLVALRILTMSDKSSVFYKSEIRRIYDDSKVLNDLLPMDPNPLNSQDDLKKIENWQQGDHEAYVNHHNELEGEFVISDILVGDVIESN